MNKFSRSLAVIGLFLALALASPAEARGKKKAPTPSQRPSTISSLSPSSITINEANSLKTFAITQFTEITIKGQRAELSALQPGMTVSVTMGTDPTKLARINAGDAPIGHGSKK